MLIFEFNQSTNFGISYIESSLTNKEYDVSLTNVNGSIQKMFRKTTSPGQVGSFSLNSSERYLHLDLGFDYDSDNIANEFDNDVDGDGQINSDDSCQYGDVFPSNSLTDIDQDGCKDSTEDIDDDGDGLNDNLDFCPTGI